MIDNQEVLSSLLMDRGSPLGNSEDIFNRHALHVKIGNNPGEPVPVYLTDATAGQNFFASVETITTPGAIQTLISDTNLSSVGRHVHTVYVICRIEGTAHFRINGSIVGSLRTGAAIPNARFSFDVPRSYLPTEIFTVDFTSRSGSPISDIECHIFALDHN